MFFYGGVDLEILIVGHDTELADLTGKILKRKGYDACSCRDISDAEKLISRENVRLVIADLETRQSERLQFCKSIKGMEKPPKLLFIGRSGEEETIMLNAGADDWIQKPYKTAVFLARTSALLR